VSLDPAVALIIHLVSSLSPCRDVTTIKHSRWAARRAWQRVRMWSTSEDIIWVYTA